MRVLLTILFVIGFVYVTGSLLGAALQQPIVITIVADHRGL
jgi:hypothetical protein